MRPAKRILLSALLLAPASASVVAFAADDPKPKPENTISIHPAQPVTPQKFAQPFTILISDITDRSGNPQPMLVYKPRGGIFTDRMPTEILREALENSLKPAGLLASDKDSADLVARVYVFKFGLAASSGMDFFGSVEFSVMLKNPKTGATQEVRASGTSIANVAMLKKNIQKNVQENLETALNDALINFFRGVQLKDAVKTLMKAQENPAPAAEHPADKPSAPAAQPQAG